MSLARRFEAQWHKPYTQTTLIKCTAMPHHGLVTYWPERNNRRATSCQAPLLCIRVFSSIDIPATASATCPTASQTTGGPASACIPPRPHDLTRQRCYEGRVMGVSWACHGNGVWTRKSSRSGPSNGETTSKGHYVGLPLHQLLCPLPRHR